MKLEKWALLAEIVSGVAIVVTLIVLIFETNANTGATLAANRQSIASRAEAILFRQTDPALARVIAKVVQGSDLDEVESIIYFGFLHGRMRNVEEAYLQYLEGNLSRQYWETRLNAALANLQTQYSREVFYEAITAYTQEFREEITQAITQEYGE